MTVTSRTLDLQSPASGSEQPADATEAATAAELVHPRGTWRMLLLVLAGLGVLYGLLQNPYWVPSGDSEVYISIARDLVRGYGYQFNGQPVAMVPPGWPWMMAAVMKLWPYFLPLKLLAMSCMIGAMVCAYFIVLRYVPPGKAALIILLTASITHVYQATFWLISESAFCFVSTLALLLAFQVRDGRRHAWRIALLAALCAAAVLVRWAGVLGCILVVAVLLDGRFLPRPGRQWFAALLSVTLTAGMFFGLRHAMTHAITSEQLAAARAFGGAGEDTGSAEAEEPTTGPAFTGMDREVSRTYKLITDTTPGKGYDDRFFGWGRWLSWLYWQPFRAAAGSPVLEMAANTFGWVLLLLLLVPTIAATLRMRWLWLGLLLYCGALSMNWPLPNARYLVPVAFLLTLGIFKSVEQLRAQPRWLWLFAGAVAAVGAAFVVGIAFDVPALAPRADAVALALAAGFLLLALGLPLLIARFRQKPPIGAWGSALRICMALFVVGTLACNLVLWGVDVWVARADDFYARYEAGMNQNLIAAARFLNAQGDAVGDGQIAVTPAYVNLNRRRSSPFGLRATAMLTGRSVISLPKKWQDYPPGPKLSNWMVLNNIQYYIHQRPVSPWRVWHFRVAWWQVMRTGEIPDKDLPSGWELWHVEGRGKMTQVELEPSRNWPKRVPGL